MVLEIEHGEFTLESAVTLMLCGKAEWDPINAFIQWVKQEEKDGPILDLTGSRENEKHLEVA